MLRKAELHFCHLYTPTPPSEKPAEPIPKQPTQNACEIRQAETDIPSKQVNNDQVLKHVMR